DFDQIFSFDRSDVEADDRLEFLPLFYGREFDRSAQRETAPIYDACFIGTIHTDRYKVLQKIVDELQRKGRKVFVFCYYPSRALYRIRTLFDPGFRRFGKRFVTFNGLPLTDVVSRI